MNEADVLAVLLNDPNLLPSEREAIQRVIQRLPGPTVATHAPETNDTPAGNLEGMRPALVIRDITPKS